MRYILYDMAYHKFRGETQVTAETSTSVKARAPEVDCDVAIIGAGVVGACCALALQTDGLQVALFDGAGPGEGCSKGNAGHLAVEHISPLANASTLLQVPKMLLQPNGPLVLRWRYLPYILPWLTRFVLAGRPSRAKRATQAIAALNARAIEAFDALDERFHLDGLIRKDGTLLACHTDRGFAAAREDAAHLARHNVRADLLSRDELRKFDPLLNDKLRGGVLYPHSAHVMNPHRLVVRLVEALQTLGGRFIQAQVQDLEPDERGCRVIASPGVVRARYAVVAAGAWSRPFAARLGHRVPLDTERGYHYMLLDPSMRPRVPTSSHEHRFVITPMEHGVRIAGRVELGGLHLPMNPARATQLLPLAQELLPELSSSRHEIWMGFRPTLPDSLPVIDRARRHPQILFAFGHHHLGLTQAAVTGELIRDLIAGRPAAIDLQPFRIDRF